MYVMLRGMKDGMDRFINDCLAQYLPYEYEPGKVGKLQLGMRPIQLYEIVFPEDQLENVCGMIQPYSLQGTGTKEMKIATWLRRFLRLKKIPKVPPKNAIPNKYVSVVGLGLKKDNFSDEKIEFI